MECSSVTSSTFKKAITDADRKKTSRSRLTDSVANVNTTVAQPAALSRFLAPAKPRQLVQYSAQPLPPAFSIVETGAAKNVNLTIPASFIENYIVATKKLTGVNDNPHLEELKSKVDTSGIIPLDLNQTLKSLLKSRNVRELKTSQTIRTSTFSNTYSSHTNGSLAIEKIHSLTQTQLLEESANRVKGAEATVQSSPEKVLRDVINTAQEQLKKQGVKAPVVVINNEERHNEIEKMNTRELMGEFLNVTRIESLEISQIEQRISEATHYLSRSHEYSRKELTKHQSKLDKHANLSRLIPHDLVVRSKAIRDKKAVDTLSSNIKSTAIITDLAHSTLRSLKEYKVMLPQFRKLIDESRAKIEAKKSDYSPKIYIAGGSYHEPILQAVEDSQPTVTSQRHSDDHAISGQLTTMTLTDAQLEQRIQKLKKGMHPLITHSGNNLAPKNMLGGLVLAQKSPIKMLFEDGIKEAGDHSYDVSYSTTQEPGRYTQEAMYETIILEGSKVTLAIHVKKDIAVPQLQPEEISLSKDQQQLYLFPVVPQDKLLTSPEAIAPRLMIESIFQDLPTKLVEHHQQSNKGNTVNFTEKLTCQDGLDIDLQITVDNRSKYVPH